MKDEILNKSSIEALFNLIDVIEKADSDGKVVKISADRIDTLVNIAEKTEQFTEEELSEIKNKYSKRRKKNQEKVTKLSETAEDIEKGRAILGKIKKKEQDEER